MTHTDIPDVGDTDLTREEMEEVAAECGLDPDGLSDQQLLERLGVALGEIGESEVEEHDGGDGQSSGTGLRAKVAARLEDAAGRLRPDGAEPPDGAGTDDEGGAGTSQGEGDEEDEGDSEQTLPGEQIEGPTRNEIRDELRELGLPVTGTKDELQERLDEARGEQDDGGDEDGEDGEDAGSDPEDASGGSGEGQPSGAGLRTKVVASLEGAADRLRPAGAEPPDGADTADEGGTSQEAEAAADEGDSEQTLPGEQIEGPTRNEIRDELRELGLPVTGTKDELQERLDEARGEQDDEDGGDGDSAGSGEDTEGDDERLRDRAADRLRDAADWLSESGRDEDSSDSRPSRLKIVSAAVKRKLRA